MKLKFILALLIVTFLCIGIGAYMKVNSMEMANKLLSAGMTLGGLTLVLLLVKVLFAKDRSVN
jgi:hypothetical protein